MRHRAHGSVSETSGSGLMDTSNRVNVLLNERLICRRCQSRHFFFFDGVFRKEREDDWQNEETVQKT